MTLLGQESQTLYGEMIERVIKLEDSFVFKLYIDLAPLEECVVASLLEDNEHSGGGIGSIDKLIYIPINIAGFINIAGYLC